MSSLFDPVSTAVEAFRNGEFLVVLDDESRENEGDLIIAGDAVTTEKMAFLVRHSSGYVCAPVTTEVADRLELPLMCPNRSDRHGTAYTVSVDYRDGTTTGISAHDRALTCRKLADAQTKPDDFIRPGHLLPLRAVDGGVLKRRGHTEAAVDLCKLAGKPPVGVICEIVREEDGLMARRDDCLKFARAHGLKAITIDDLVAHISSGSATNGH
uniref:3,4-dihydroxy-2-butanone 4-phosphate synthase n=1 Tax=Blastobotrys adeninivorans TaxID=409370 RepID=A0A060T4W8_BLAAD